MRDMYEGVETVKMDNIRNSMYIGKTTPWQGSVTVVSRDYFDDIPVFKIQVSRGFRNKNTKMTSMDTSKILDGLYAFGVKCGLNAPPLLYASKINTYAVLSPPSFWENLHFTEDKHLTDMFLAYKNEYRQCFYCTDADFSALEKRIRTSTIPLIRFDDISQAHVTGGFNESQRNEFVFPGSEAFNQPPYGDNTVGLPIQVTDGRENETPTQQHNDLSSQMQSGAGQEQNNNHKWKTAKYPDFQDIKYRLESYRGWPLAEPNPRALCEAGFFFTGHSYDLVRCFCCGIGLKDFSDTDNPILEHAKNSSNCPFILDHFGSLEALERYRQRFVTEDPEEIRRMQRDIFQRQQEAANYRAKHEWFQTLQSRLDTYTHWPQHLSQSPEQLAEAGMFYTGVDDHCRCFACDGGLRKWEPGDDPWIEHCRWFPACPYAREIKGDEFINLVQLSADHALENVSNSQDEASGAMAALTIDDANIEILVEQNKDILVKDMGFSISDVKTAIFEVLQQGTTIPDIDDIITRLEVMSERKHLEEQLKQTQVPLDPEGTFPTERLLEENQRLKSLLLCHLCNKNQVNALFLPCTHHKYCLDCTEHSDKCPDCNRTIKERIRTYMT